MVAKSCQARPSEMFAIKGDFRRYCFDNAVTTFGMALEAELDGIEGKTASQTAIKRSRLLDVWMDRPLQYRSPSVATQSDTETVSFAGDGG